MMSDLARAVEYITQAMVHSVVPPNPTEVRMRVTRLLEEGVTFEQLVAALIARSHAKEEEKILGLRRTSYLTLDDLLEAEKLLGINEPTEANKTTWEKKFKSGRASNWCPRCGYAGNDEFQSMQNGTLHLSCPLCSYFEDMRYFTRKWTPEAQATFEAEREAKRRAEEAKRIATEEFKRAQQTQSSLFSHDALKVAKAIDEFLWVDDEENYEWNDVESRWMVGKINALMRLAAEFSPGTTADDIVRYFKAHLDPPDDLAEVRPEFERVATNYAVELKSKSKSEEAL